MIQLTDGIEGLPPNDVTLYYTTDPYLSNLPILAFHGPSTTANSTLNSSRIQVHIFSAAGFQSYPRITVSPNSPFYTVVDQLPLEDQGDEVCRGLAFGLLRYFKDLPEVVKTTLIVQSSHSRGRRPGSAPPLFGEQHAANIASGMIRVDNTVDVMRDLRAGLQSQSISCLDVDLVLPPGTIRRLQEEDEDDMDGDGVFDPTLQQYGSYAPLVKLFGATAFLPTSKLRRAPSKPTALNRSTSFLKEQKMSLRREMGELVDTEERYVMKTHELVNSIAQDFREKAKTKAFGSTSPSEKDLQKLFPPSLDQILRVNSDFLVAIREVMDETEEDAMKDLEAVQNTNKVSRHGGSGRVKDPSGALAFAKILLDWFPRFTDCYQDYIRASQDFPQILTSFAKQQSSFSQRVQQTGEQRLRSAIIEPVQRLPRYSLFIDNMVNCLPMSHPALRPILKARDIITAICSLDSPSTDRSQVVSRLRNLVGSWPSKFTTQGRLISAVDFIDLPAPFDTSASLEAAKSGMLLLFADSVVIVWKNRDCNLSARGIMAEVDKPSAPAMMAPATAVASGYKPLYEVCFGESFALGETHFTEGSEGGVTWMACPQEGNAASRKDHVLSATSFHAYLLQGPYEGKASKWIEEVTKAKIEGRFSEEERETEKWCLRNVNMNGNGFTVYTAVFEEGLDDLIQGRKEPAPIRIVVDHEKGTKGAPVGHYGVEVVANVTGGDSLATSTCRLEIDGLNDRAFVDAVDATTFMPVFAKRISDLLRAQYGPENPSLTSAFISHYSGILKCLRIHTENDKIKSFRPPSPAKLFSSFLSGGGAFGNVLTPSKQQRALQMDNVPSMPPPSPSKTENRKGSQSASNGKASTNSRAATEYERPSNPLFRLEETFTGYTAALQSRKGNVVGKVLRSRAAADDLTVNALYNSFIENPFDTRTSSEVSVDVLFAAFEKFMRIAWTDQIGPAVTLQNLQALQEKSAKSFPGDFADFLRIIFSDMAPQNRRAFEAIVKLLADLLDGCGNDGDRGSLTAAFAELLVVEGDPHSFINLLDRLVEDCDRLFDDVGSAPSSGYVTPAYGSLSSTTKSTWSANTSSLTSNTSIRKKFGLDTLLRQNSKSDSDPKPSMWRTLSKTNRHAATGEPTSSSLSKASIGRSRSIDGDLRFETPNKRPGSRDRPVSRDRPASRDRPTVLGAFDDRPPSSHMQPRLSTINASPPPETPASTNLSKKKRRSSLSDLKGLLASARLDSPSSPAITKGLPSLARFNSSPQTPSPTKSSIARPVSYVGDQQKENAVSLHRNVGNLTERPENIVSHEAVTVKDLWSAKSINKSNHPSSIPTPNGVIREVTPTNSPTKPATSPQKGSPQKLRLQSPQKLRERLKDEAKAINAAEASLQSELSKIGEEMARLNGGRAHSNSADIQRLSDNVRALEWNIPIVIKDLNSRNEKIKKDLEDSLQASEYKVKGLDQLYKEVCAENELLYEKFNGELSKIVKALKGKGKEEKEELITKVKDASEETLKMRKENTRLRKEILMLKTLVQGNE